MAFNVGLLVEKNKEGEGVKYAVTSVTERQGFHEVEQMDLAEGWRQIVSGELKGIGLLDVMEGQRHTWGKQIIIAEPVANCDKLQAHYPGRMIFTPAEFIDAVEHWPENEGVIWAKRIFSGEIIRGSEAK